MTKIKSKLILAIFVMMSLYQIVKFNQFSPEKTNNSLTPITHLQLSKEKNDSLQNISNQTTRQEQSQIPLLIKTEVQNLYDVNKDPQESEQRVIKIAQSLNQNQIMELELIAIDENKNTEERLASVYFLKHAGIKAQSALLHVFTSPTKIFKKISPAHSRNEMNQEFEVALRTMALESIETNVHESAGALHVPELQNNELPKYLISLYKMVSFGEQIHDPLLKKQISLSLAQENQ